LLTAPPCALLPFALPPPTLPPVCRLDSLASRSMKDPGTRQVSFKETDDSGKAISGSFCLAGSPQSQDPIHERDAFKVGTADFSDTPQIAQWNFPAPAEAARNEEEFAREAGGLVVSAFASGAGSAGGSAGDRRAAHKYNPRGSSRNLLVGAEEAEVARAAVERARRTGGEAEERRVAALTPTSQHRCAYACVAVSVLAFVSASASVPASVPAAACAPAPATASFGDAG
jgi:hypothetical protein